MSKIFLILVVVVVLLVGWNYFKPAEVITLNTSMVGSGAEGIIIYAINQLEFDKKNGLNLIINDVEPGEAVRRFFAREDQLGSRTPIDVAVSRDKGAEIKFFGPKLTSVHVLLVKSDTPYQNLSDLKGKKIAILPKATAAYQSIALELRILGTDIDKDFSLAFGGVDDTLAFINKGEVDAAFLPEPIASKLIASKRFREVLNLAEAWEHEFGVPYVFLAAGAFSDWLNTSEQNYESAKRFSKTIIEAATYINNNPAFVAQYAKDVLGLTSEEEIKLITERLPRVFPTSWDDKSISNTILVMEKAAEFGFIENVPSDLDSLFIRF